MNTVESEVDPGLNTSADSGLCLVPYSKREKKMYSYDVEYFQSSVEVSISKLEKKLVTAGSIVSVCSIPDLYQAPTATTLI